MLKYIKYFVPIIFLCNFIYILNGNSATINALSCSQTHVQEAINSASDGDTVTIPSGSCTWTTKVYLIKGIEIIGSGIDSTVITDGTPNEWKNTPFWIEAAGKTIRISGMTFDGNALNDPRGIIYNSSAGGTFRFDHLKFNDHKNRSIIIVGSENYGVIDHCTFYKNVNEGGFSYVDGGDWSLPMSFGTADAVYFEDCTFDCAANRCDDSVDSKNGGRTVLRYNSFDHIVLGNHGYDSVPRSALQREIYNNDWTNTYTEQQVPSRAIQFRGGTGIIYNNTFSGNYGSDIAVTNYRSCSEGYYPGKEMCDGNSSDDQNTSPIGTYHGWACKDQIGRGTDQGSYPMYEWNNTRGGSDVDIQVYDAYGGTCYTTIHIQEGRDYYNDTQMTGYTAYTYPHPLTGASPPPDDEPPAPPAGLQKK